ncbi:antibiotic biosynthesis monooxygenase family protein [Zhongshania sp.]|jgi:quinol monooxygenase YgiN|uniref:antibiotic biosynthesis monooxygenase family protein n=1 Tax=Zhongshania sp. TaxID=1971902 RepID=UPI002A7EF75B|nr:antibiotic biosynthesis monooxygenase family protein [Zhongshania sp.]
MVTENVNLSIKDGEQDAFKKSFKLVKTIINSADGCIGVRLSQCIENNLEFMLQVEWTSVDAHMKFIKTTGFNHFRDALTEFYSSKPTMQHYNEV